MLDDPTALRRFLDSLFAFVAVLETDGAVAEVNRPALEAAGTGGDVRGKKLWECPWWDHSKAARARVREACERAAAGELVREEIAASHVGRGALTLDCQIAPIHDGEGPVTHLIASAVDVSRREQAELEGGRFFELSLDLLAVASTRDGRWKRVNPAFQRLLGWTEEELLSMPFADIVHPDDARLFPAHAAMAPTAARPTNVEHRVRCKDGGYRWIAWNAVPYPAEGLTFCVGRDVTDRKRAEEDLRETEARFREMADGLPLIVWVHDEDGAQELVNETFCEYFGVTREEMKGGRWEILMHPEDANGYKSEFLACVEERRPFHALVRVMRGDGAWRWIESWGRPRFTSDGTFRGFVGTSLDVTERREAEQRLRESDRRKDEFLAMLGHELRNPLAAIQNASELLELVRAHPERVLRAQRVLQRQSAHMSRLIDGLLEVSRISRGKIHIERRVLDLRGVLEVVLHDRAPHVADRGLDLKTLLPEEPLWVEGDDVRLVQVFDNLMGNALKFTEAPGRIIVKLRAEDRWAVVSVRDTGVGIHPEMLSRVFEPFQQEAQGVARAAGGLGLGLALVKGLVELHGGQVLAHSEGAGTGAEMSVRLPLAKPPTGAEEEPPDGARAPARRILVVEDNADAAQILRDLLELKGHEVTVAADGQGALDAIRAVGADVVLCDIGLPGMSGYDLARAIREDPLLRETPLVAMTGYGQASDRREAEEAGFDEHLTKPVRARRLDEVLTRLAGRARPPLSSSWPPGGARG